MPGNNETFNVTIKAGVDLSGVEQQAKKLKGLFNNVDFKIPKNVSSSFEQHYESFSNLFKQYQDQLNKGFDTKAEVTSFKKLGKAIAGEINNMVQDINKLNNSNVSFNIDTSKIEELSGKVGEIQTKIQTELSNANIHIDFDKMFEGATKSSKLTEMVEEFKNLFNSGDLGAAGNQIDKIINKINSLTTTKTNMVEALGIKNLEEELGGADEAIKRYFTDLKNGLQSANTDTLVKLFKELGVAEEDLNKYLSDTTQKVQDHLDAMEDTGKATQDAFKSGSTAADSYATSVQSAKQQLDSLKQSTEYFFGLKNMFNLLKRGIREAIKTVSELDKAMTETAVVTNFSVGDMWSKLPLYTEQANQLGSTIKDVYEATTLYYQQGLDTDQAIGLANETLKMARIAGMEAAEATDAMTAALRGFNMEINGMSAQRINDVYSKIAATTASNTEELSTAMTKTASLAHSAGMSFEGTTAFLAQMIETTREAPENLGTAMKTIIARFQEMKKNPLEIVDVEGEEVSYNKIDTALQSIGVSLKDTNGQFRNLDEVFLEISSKWDSLTQTQQRYIATTAAGSRQQSRFIAMMSNYDRVTQLVEYANNSAGASQEQFGKTLESFEAKVNKLKNAWQEYLMGIANNTIIKGVVDTITSGLNLINKLIDQLSRKSDILQSILSLGTGFIGLRAAGKVLNRLVGGVGGFLDPNSTFGKGFLGGNGKNGQQVVEAQTQKYITAPILNRLDAILQSVNKVSNKNSKDSEPKANYKDNFQQIRTLGANNKFGEAGALFDGLTDKEQRSLLVNSGGSKNQMQNAAANWFKGLNLDEQAQKAGLRVQKAIWKGMSKGTINVKDGIKLLGNPQQWGEYFGDDVSKAVAQSYIKKINNLTKQAKSQTTKEFEKELGVKTANEVKAQLKANEELQAKYNESVNNKVRQKGGIPLEDQELETLTRTQKLANAVGKLGNGFTQAGYAVSSFGSILKQVGGPIGAVGSALESVGGIISSLGMTISGLATGIPAIVGVLGGPLTIALAAVAALGTVAFVQHTKHLKEVHEAAQKVVDDYETINKSTSDNIATLKQYKEELASLKDGVDDNGYNKNLTTDEYDRYLEIVDKIAEINPDIVKYYNAQGHAVLDLNSALEDTLALEEKRQKEGLYNYTSQTSLQKLLDDRATNSTWKKYNNGITYYDENGNATKGDSLWGKSGATVNQLKNAGFDLNRLTKYGINVNDLLKGERSSILLFVKNQSKILNEAEKSLTGSWDKVGDDITNSFNELGEAFNEFNEINQPIFEQLATWIGQDNRFQELGAEQKGFVTTGLQSLAMEDMSASDMRKEARKVIRIIDGYFGEGSDYEKIMEQVKKAQENFALDLNEDSYNEAVKDAKTQLQTLIDQSKKIGGAAGEALTNAYTRALDNLENQTDSSVADIIQALNPLSDEIAEAEGAFGKFQENSGSDFSTARKNMSQFYDIMEDEVHNAGYGDASFWQAATEMYGEAAVKAADGSVAAIEALNDKMKPLFEDGADGYNNFVQYLYDSKDKLQKALPTELFEKVFNANGELDFNFDDEDIPALAKALDLSANSFTALLNSMRQFSNVHFGDAQEVKEALMLSDTTGIGQEKVYTNRDELISQIRASGAGNTYTEIEKILSDLFSKGVMTLPGGDQLTETDFEDWKGDFQGSLADWLSELQSDLKITDIPSLIATFDKMGYSKQDIFDYGKKFHEQGLLQGDFSAELLNTEYDKYIEEQNLDPVVEGLSGIESAVQAIHSILAGGDIAAGYLNPEQSYANDLQEQVLNIPQLSDFLRGRVGDKEYLDIENQLNKADAALADYIIDLGTGLDTAARLGDQERVEAYKAELVAAKDLQTKIENLKTVGKEAYENVNNASAPTEDSSFGQKFVDWLWKDMPKGEVEPITIPVEPDAADVNAQLAQQTKDVNPIDVPVTIEKVEGGKDIVGDTEATIPVGADTNLAAGKVEQQTAEIESNEVEMPTVTEVDETALDATTAKIETPRFIQIYPEFRGDWSKTIYFKGGSSAAAKGLNNHISSAGFYTGSAARGHGGTLGPNGHGGLTLTGEKGFEIAWLPSENRSMIVGANGPQMVDLPSDAVVWNHEQSKKIVKQQGIPAGSLAEVSGTPGFWGSGPIDVNIVNDETSSSGSGSGSSSGSSSDKEKDPKRTNWYKEEITRFNLNQSINKITAEIEKVTKSIEKSLDKLGTKYSDIAKNVETQAKLINQNIANQKALQKSYQDQLNLLDNGGRSLWMDIIDSAGESSQKSISTGQFVYKQANGSYAIDENKVLSYAASLGGDAETQKVNAETIFNTINSELNNLTSGLSSATKAIEDGKEELQNLIKQVQDAFYAWENELTKIYDLNQQLENSDIRRNRLASENSMLLAQISAGFNSAADAAERLQAIERDDAKLIRERISLLKNDIKAKQEQLKQLASSADEESDWAKYNWNNQQTLKAGGTLSINDIAQEQQAADKYLAARYIEAFTKITRNADNSITLDFNEEALENERLNGNISEATYNAIKEGFDALQEANEDLQQTIIDASDFMTELYEEYNKHIQTLAELEKDLIDAFVEAAQREVNKLEALNSALTNAAKAVLDQVKKNIDARRKSEDNAKTEGDIAQKQARLAVLRANTGGGNQVEIAQLEKEISDAQRSYGRTLEDQLMANMQSQADEASKQRQEQIDLAKQQIEYNKQIGLYASMADDLLKDGNLNIVAIEETLKITRQDGIGYYNEILEGTKLQSQIAEAVSASQGLDELADILGVTGDDVKSIGEELAELITTWNTQMMKQEEVISTGTGGSSSVKSPTVSSNPEPKTSTNSSSNSNSSTTKKDYSSGWLATLPETNSNYFSSAQVKTLQHGLNTMKWSGLISFGADLAIDGVIGSKTTTAIKALQKLVGTTQDGIWGPQTGAATHKKYPKYARGGLASKTGPAWLDGTPTKPELVLNAQDTKNFIALKDILSGVMRSISHTDTSNIYNSPTNFEINVNVEKIASDYDVDKLTERIKRNIVKDATYRNVTAVRNFR